MNNYFKSAGDLIQEDSRSNYFKPAGDISNSVENITYINSTEDIKEYLKRIQSGKKNYGPTLEGGRMFVSLDQLKQMVYDGYNIISANYFEQIQMIEVEFDLPTKSKTR